MLRAFSRKPGSFAYGSWQRLQHTLRNLLLQLWELILKGLRHGARDDLFDLDRLSLVRFLFPFRHA